MLKTHSFIVLLATACAGLSAETITPAGVAGNSGEQGESLIRLGANHVNRRGYNPVGCGVVLDRFGSLWTRTREDTVTRLAADGRQLGQFPAPESDNKYDALTAIGDTLMLLAKGSLLTLPVTAEPGTGFRDTGLRLRAMSLSPHNNRLAGITPDGAIVWVDASGAAHATTASAPEGISVEVMPGGDILAGCFEQATGLQWLRKFTDGKEVTDAAWPRVGWRYALNPRNLAPAPFLKADGEGGYFVGGSGFLAHLDENFAASPGTLLGKQNDHVIGGGGDWNTQMGTARGIVKYDGDLYIVCGGWGQLFFAEWPDPRLPMKLRAWFAAVPECATLAVDAKGNIFADHNLYAWDDTPDSFPQQTPTANLRLGPILPVENLGHISLLFWAHGAGGWALVLRRGENLAQQDWIDRGTGIVREEWQDRLNHSGMDVMPAVVIPDPDEKGGHILLCMADVEKARAVHLHPNGSFNRIGEFVPFNLTQPGGKLTSLAVKNPTTLLAAVDHEIVEITRANGAWRETRRWGDWGNAPSQKFGNSLHIACDNGRLLVSDTEKNRLLLFKDGVRGAPVATFGGEAGTRLTEMDAPTVVSLSGERAVAYDSGNQRILKLEVK